MEYEYNFETPFSVSDGMRDKFNENGVIMVRNLLSKEEVDYIMASMQAPEFKQTMRGVDDGEGRKAHMNIWNQPGKDVTGMVGRCEKVVNTCEALLEGEVYHYHSKLMGKPPREGGRHLWHQDYGYWYQNGCLFPNMITVFIAMDKCEKANGCLQYLPGSHLCGRLDHHRLGGQFEADTDRIEDIKKHCPLAFAEMESGDALFMHCNVLHCSSANLSDKRRWALLCCYNRADNNPIIKHHHPQYTPLKKVTDESILSCTTMIDVEGKDFMPLGVDKTSLLEDVKA
ncbi:probable phytanoyl-CoA dioxygenase [Mya arenaria]|uniref:probable phytanoyl-CoA dioxygenase n=1 Tax=Mya arenaria TaxID=6604 RepID=UPI0022E5D7EE|nr:probable phytanoyl-CoA dioxygenase [Mya arenaria]